MPASYSLYELNEYIRRVIALNFSEPVWVHCEISQVKEVRGNVYLDLVYHDEQSKEITAQISANIWFKSYLFLKTKLGQLLPSLLREGSQVLLKVQVEFNERYGIKLIIEDIDPAFTMGQMELQRQKILQKLSDEGLLHINKTRILPTVIQRVAVISSSTAAGFIDFQNHILHNSFGYNIKINLFQAALQGQNTEREVCKALDDILDEKEKYDCIVIIRGGGSKLDLSGFDNFNIGAKIAKSFLPVITGIGHDIDSTVADTVSYLSLKTPTAVADYLLEHNAVFENRVIETYQWIGQWAAQILKQKQMALQQTIQLVKIMPGEMIKKSRINIFNTEQQISIALQNTLSRSKQHLYAADNQLALLNPSNTLKRGYTILRQDNIIIKRLEHFDSNKETDIEFYDGTAKIKKT